VRVPTPGRRESCATRFSTAGLSTCPILPTCLGSQRWRSLQTTRSRLADFYEQLLGLAADSRSDSHASFDVGGTTLFIHVKGELPDHEGAPNSDHVGFALDQDAAADRARDAGAEVVGPKDYYWGRSAYLRDPDGRAVELTSD
jgi:catechol-2,3-dioxygenase